MYDEQQFYLTKMMLLIFSIIVMSSYLYLVCVLYRVLKKTYVNQYLSVVASIYSLCATPNNTQSKLCSMFKYSPSGKGIVYGLNGHNTNGKGIMTRMKYILIIYSPN